jgi:hypothetical protein
METQSVYALFARHETITNGQGETVPIPTEMMPCGPYSSVAVTTESVYGLPLEGGSVTVAVKDDETGMWATGEKGRGQRLWDSFQVVTRDSAQEILDAFTGRGVG